MARLNNGINGGISGRVGTVIGSSRNGVPYIKVKNVRTAPQTPNELIAKERFATVHRFLQPLLGYVREGFRHQPKIGYNGAKSHALMNAVHGEPMHSYVKPELIRVSEGVLPISPELAFSLQNGLLVFTWESGHMEQSNPNDQFMPLAYNVEKERAYFTTTGGFRKTGTDSLRINVKPGQTYHIYAAFCAADRAENSRSEYLGALTF